jgi:hypothetical protein
MEESVTEWSEWWEPSAPEIRAQGELRFDPASGASLILHGELPALRSRRWSAPSLFGETFDGTALTIDNPAIYETNRHTRAGNPSRFRMRLRSGTLLRGCHADPDKLLVERASVRLTGLRELCLHPWPGTKAFLVETGFGGTRRIAVDGGSLTFRRNNARRVSQFEESSELQVDVLIESSQALSLSDFEEHWLLPLQGLIVFAARAPVQVTSFVLEVNTPGVAASIHPAIRRGANDQFWNTEQVEVLSETPSLSGKPPARYDRPLVPFNALGDGAEEFIGLWWALYNELGKAVTFLISALESELFLEHRFLTEMSFAESYHRAKHDKPKVPADEHQSNVTKMLKVIAGKAQREHYRVRLKFAGEQSARQRLKLLVKRAHETLPEVPKLTAKLADQLVDTRNALTHLDPSGPPGLDGVDLVYAATRLQLVIQTNLLLDLQLGKDKVSELVLTSYANQMPVRDFSAESGG